MLTEKSPGVLSDRLKDFFPEVGFPTALAPMQDVTGLPFMNLVSQYGPPDLFFTEYFRVHANARLDPGILSSVTENNSGKPVFAQLIGEDIEHIVRFAKELQQYDIAGIDLNLGCPAPRVYRKNVGGGLLRDPKRINQILHALQQSCECPITVKTRIGFEDGKNFSQLLDIFAANEIELLSLHARTVRGGYRSPPQYEYVEQAIGRLNCPVLLNGEVNSPHLAVELIKQTGASGVMIGRSAIRNPWIFLQIKQILNGADLFRPTLGDLNAYIESLYQALFCNNVTEVQMVARLKKFLNFIGLSVDENGEFLYFMRRASTKEELNKVCEKFLLNEDKSKQLMELGPYTGLIARPSTEGSSCH